jgi:hypothetical protein
MNAEHDHVESNHNPSDATSARATGSNGARRKEFARRAMAAASGLRSQVDEGILQNPYTTVGIACVVGMGVGVVLSSRILRTVLTAALAAAAVEFTRGFVRETLFRVEVA